MTAETRSAASRRVRSANAGRRRIVHAATGKNGRPHPGEQLGQAEVQVGQVAARGGDQRRADDPRAEQLGPQRRQPHDRHAAHRVPDEDDRARAAPAPRAPRPGRGPAARWSSARASPRPEAPWPALVVEDQPGVGAVAVGGGQLGGEGPPLEGPGRHRQRVAVHEDDGQRRVPRADLLDGEQHAVVGLHERACGRPPRDAAPSGSSSRRSAAVRCVGRLTSAAELGRPARGARATRLTATRLAAIRRRRRPPPGPTTAADDARAGVLRARRFGVRAIRPPRPSRRSGGRTGRRPG